MINTQTRLYLEIAQRIETLIRRQPYRAGERLPPERELAMQLEVSRTSVREALIALEIAGRIEVRQGSGIYVCPPAEATSLPPKKQADRSPFEILQMRRLLESEAAALAAQSASVEEIAAIERIYKDLGSDDRYRRDQADHRFHTKLAEASHNAVLAELIDSLWHDKGDRLTARLEELSLPALAGNRSLKEHKAVLEALKKRDPLAARRAMRQHIDSVIRRRLLVLKKDP